jgi:hypothetical protein
MRPGLLLLAVLLAFGCALRPEEQRGRAVSVETFERVLPYLEALDPGDDLRIFERARVVQLEGERPRVVIPAWIPSLSGGAAGGLSMLGQLIGRRGDVLYGSHVFGFVSGDRIVPRFQVMTRATLLDEGRFRERVAEGERDLGVLPRRSGVLYFGELHVAGTRVLYFPELPTEHSTGSLPAGGAASFYSEAAYRGVAPVLDGLPVGTDLLSLLWILEAEFVTSDHGDTHSLYASGFLRYRTVRTRTLETTDGIFKLRPFGWVDGEREVVARIAIFENDRLRRVVRHDGRPDWTAYLSPSQASTPRVD